MYNTLNNNKGIALITALMLTLITLVIILGVMFQISNNIKSGGANKAYRNVTEAAYGGADLLLQDVIPRLFANRSSAATAAALAASSGTADEMKTQYSSIFLRFNSNACLQQKLTTSVLSGWPACNSDRINPKNNPDITFQLAGTSGQSYTVYSKIIDTIEGVPYPPTPAGGGLIGGGVTESSGGTTANLSHYVYRVEVSGERTINPSEKSNVSILYEY